MVDAALRPLSPGPLLRIGNERLAVEVAPQAGGRITQIAFDGMEWLCGHAEDNAAAIAWGSYPMLPWAGRIRRGRFEFEGRTYELPASLGAHAIHGVGFVLPWTVVVQTAESLELMLHLPEDGTWPFGGVARQRIAVSGTALRLELSLTAGERAMPMPVLGWHPWFRKPERLDFAPGAIYPRDAEGIAVHPTIAPTPGPWDDCFINTRPVALHRAGQTLRLVSDCDHWVVYDQTAHATCVEPQSGPPDAFNLQPGMLLPGETYAAWFDLEWGPQQGE